MCGSRSSAMNLRIVPIISADKRPSMDVSEVEEDVCRDGQEGEEGGKRGYKCVVVRVLVGVRQRQRQRQERVDLRGALAKREFGAPAREAAKILMR